MSHNNKIPKKAYQNKDFLHSEKARTIRILSEYLEPTSRLDHYRINNTVLFLGSSRTDLDAKESLLKRYYWEAEELAYKIAHWAIRLKPNGKNFVICTGGGPGIMEAANRGAQRAGGLTIGMNISLPFEQYPNSFISPELNFMFHYFFMRKFFLINRARAVIAFPGGFGTMDEIFEMLTLVQTDKIHRNKVDIILYGEDFWRKTVDFDHLVKYGVIASEDVKLFKFVSTPQEAFDLLKKDLPRFLK